MAKDSKNKKVEQGEGSRTAQNAKQQKTSWSSRVRRPEDGSKPKYYTDPVTGKVFRNIRDAKENIETGELGKYLSGHRRKSIRKRYSVKVESHFYSDPVEGNVFRKDASDYIETGKLAKYASGPRRKYIRERSTLREESPPPILVDELKSLSTSRN